MALSRDFTETVVNRTQRDVAYANGLLDEAISALLENEPAVARLLLRDLINGSLGFEPLSLEVGIPSKSLHRMLSVRGNPNMNSLSAIICALRQALREDGKIDQINGRPSGAESTLCAT
jgi:DNA-binding phage protein